MPQLKKYKFSDFVNINPLVKLKAFEKYSFIEMKDLNDGQRYAYPSIERTLTGGARFEEADTLFARITPCLENGKICQAKGLKDGKGFGSTEFLVFRGKEGISDSNFVFYLSRWDDVRRFAELNMVGTSGRQRVPKDVFENLELELPEDLPTQTRIASILSALDDKIELNRRTNHTLEQMAQTLFKKYFVTDIDPDNLPEGWRWGKLGDIYKTTSGGTPSRSKMEFYTEGNIAWVKSKELNGDFILDTEEKITEDAVKYSSAKKLPVHSVLVAMYGATVGEIATLSIPATCNQAICAILPNENYSYSYIFQFLKLNKEELINRASGSAQQNISQLVIQNFELIIPPVEVVKEFDKIVNDLFKRLESNLKENKYLSQLRDTLLPKLMSGEINVN